MPLLAYVSSKIDQLSLDFGHFGMGKLEKSAKISILAAFHP